MFLNLLAIGHPLFSANLTFGVLPFDLFTGLLVLTRPWFTNQIFKPWFSALI
ncbi:MAG: hypothetical protein ACYTXA_27320 [Nostoc sp.]